MAHRRHSRRRAPREALWASVDDARLRDDTLAALGERGDVDAMFRTTLAAIVAGVLETDHDRGDPR
ncbi:MAG: hypothetical protein R2698_10120 [Microthrixaceae bacterium]